MRERIRTQFWTWGLCWLAAGCAGVTLGETLPSVPLDSTFRSGTLRSGDHGELPYYLKIFEKDGRIAACGAAVHTGGTGAFGETLYEKWMEEATLNLRSSKSNERRPLVSARFVRFERLDRADKRASCVLTKMKAESEWLRGTPFLTGVPVQASF